MKIFRMVIISLWIGVAALVAVYALWFIYMQIFELPAGYYQHHEGGKGAGICTSRWFCTKLWGVYCCNLPEVLLNFFTIGFAVYIYFLRNIFVPLMVSIYISAFSISFLIQYSSYRKNVFKKTL